LGDYNKSLEIYEKALTIDSEYGPIWFGIGEVYYNEQQYHESYLYFRKALKLNPSNGLYWRYLGAVQLELGFDKHAIRSFERATHYSPSDKESWIMRFITSYFGQGIESAYQIACQAIEIFQTEAEFYFHKTACLIEKDQIQAAEQSFAQALSLNPAAFDDFAIFYPKIYSFDNFRKLINTFVRTETDETNNS
jgi:tetratricopeptide (TPR) repeat protein